MDAVPHLQAYLSFMQEKVGPLVHEAARRCGHIFGKITFKLSDSPHPEFSVNPATSEIFASKAAIDVLQGNNLATVSRELKAVLAHEVVGHVGHHKSLLFGAKASLFAGPLVAIAAYELIKRNLLSGQSKEEAAKKIADMDKSDSGHSDMNDRLYAMAKYVAIGALGLAAGGFLARHLSRSAEFAADKRAIEFTKDPQALISALKRLEGAATAAIKDTTKEARSVTEWLQDMVLKFENSTYRAHPQLAERIDYIRSLG